MFWAFRLSFYVVLFLPAALLLVLASCYIVYRTSIMMIASIIRPLKEEALRIVFRAFQEKVTRDELIFIDASSLSYFLFYRVSEAASGEQRSRKVRPEEIRLLKRQRCDRTSSSSLQMSNLFERGVLIKGSYRPFFSIFQTFTGWRMSLCTWPNTEGRSHFLSCENAGSYPFVQEQHPRRCVTYGASSRIKSFISVQNC